TVKKEHSQDFQKQVREVSANKRVKLREKKKKAGNGNEGFGPELEYKERNLHFQFAATSFEDETRTEYRFKLEGYDKQ
ncbi:MAG: hypothetical protein GY757_56600, partial [bacterium]|nr:hypothetical protein [bacterium]